MNRLFPKSATWRNPKHRSTAAVVLALVAAMLAASCGGGSESADTSTTEAPTTTEDPAAKLVLRDISADLAALAEIVGEDPRLVSLNYGQWTINAEVRTVSADPAVDDLLDKYLGQMDPATGVFTWNDPEPVKLSVGELEKLDAREFRASRINWPAIPVVTDQLVVDMVEIIPESVAGASVAATLKDNFVDGKHFFTQLDVNIYITVVGLRGRGELIAAPDGTVVKSGRA